MNNKLKHIKNSGFTSPQNYFETVENAVFDKLGEEQDLNEISDSGFTMPNDYFNSLEDKVFGKINEEKPKVISLFSKRNFVYLSGIAAAVLIMFSIFFKGENPLTQELDYNLVESYIIDQDISSYELASLLTDEELSSMNSEIMDDVFNDIDMEDYLLENVDLEEIIEQ